MRRWRSGQAVAAQDQQELAAERDRLDAMAAELDERLAKLKTFAAETIAA